MQHANTRDVTRRCITAIVGALISWAVVRIYADFDHAKGQSSAHKDVSTAVYDLS